MDLMKEYKFIPKFFDLTVSTNSATVIGANNSMFWLDEFVEIPKFNFALDNVAKFAKPGFPDKFNTYVRAVKPGKDDPRNPNPASNSSEFYQVHVGDEKSGPIEIIKIKAINRAKALHKKLIAGELLRISDEKRAKRNEQETIIASQKEYGRF
ncbi:MAG: hypothetical protein ACEQSB_00750 [Undibacterium sp.]